MNKINLVTMTMDELGDTRLVSLISKLNETINAVNMLIGASPYETRGGYKPTPEKMPPQNRVGKAPTIRQTEEEFSS